jgi:predicted transcriptional regulator
MGRRSKYETHVKPRLHEIPKLYETMTEAQIAKELGVSVSAFENYKLQYPELVTALRDSKKELIEELKATLKKKAKGYFYEEEKIVQRKEGKQTFVVVEKTKKYAHPDTGAIHLLLKNLDPEWHNDDKKTMDLKKEQLEIAREKAEANQW